MGVITWSFEDSFQGWDFSDDSTSDNGSSSRSHDGVNECISVRLIDPGPANALRAIGTNFLAALSVPFVIGDTVAMDYSAPSDGKGCTKSVTIFYTDDTSEVNSVSSATSGTITVTASVNKTVERIDCKFVRQCDAVGGRCPVDLTICLEEVRMTTAAAVIATAGKLRTPQDFIEDEGAGAAGGAGGGAGGNIASISADGTFIYMSSFNDLGFPTLIKFGTALTADGSVVFDPLTGARIGVQCGRFNADHVWIAGTFGGTNVVEKSEDAGSSFSVKDNAAMGTIRTFEIGPGSDTTVLVFDGDNGDILETIDDGGSWTTINAAVTPLINSLARFGLNPEEIVAGNAGAANDSINYSPNTGVNLEDYQTGVFPNADSTKVIAN